MLSDENKTEFYKFLNGDITVADLEGFIYQQSELEYQLGNDIYLELISFNFKDKYSLDRLRNLILDKVVDEGQFETWKLAALLSKFINNPSDIKDLLDEFYHLYCITHDRQGNLVNGYRFLGNLGLNYFWWMDEGYLKTNYGDRWKQEYDKCFDDVEFYHRQLQPIAQQILDALEDGRIVITKEGYYSITDDLKTQLESDTILTLEHPARKY